MVSEDSCGHYAESMRFLLRFISEHEMHRKRHLNTAWILQNIQANWTGSNSKKCQLIPTQRKYSVNWNLMCADKWTLKLKVTQVPRISIKGWISLWNKLLGLWVGGGHFSVGNTILFIWKSVLTWKTLYLLYTILSETVLKFQSNGERTSKALKAAYEKFLSAQNFW